MGIKKRTLADQLAHHRRGVVLEGVQLHRDGAARDEIPLSHIRCRNARRVPVRQCVDEQDRQYQDPEAGARRAARFARWVAAGTRSSTTLAAGMARTATTPTPGSERDGERQSHAQAPGRASCVRLVTGVRGMCVSSAPAIRSGLARLPAMVHAVGAAPGLIVSSGAVSRGRTREARRDGAHRSAGIPPHLGARARGLIAAAGRRPAAPFCGRCRGCYNASFAARAGLPAT